MKNKRGYLLLAFGSKRKSNLDYGKLAVCCALSIKTNLKHNHVTIIMDEGTKKWVTASIPKNILDVAFDNVIMSKEKAFSGKPLL